jgi:hypothetical protein
VKASVPKVKRVYATTSIYAQQKNGVYWLESDLVDCLQKEPPKS